MAPTSPIRCTATGRSNLVFVSGFVSHAELVWEEPAIAGFLRRLASFSRLLTYDKRGQGLSDRLGRPPTLEESMDDLKAVMDAAECERAAIFGISEGGPLSALFAATHPDRVSSLVLYGTYARLTEAPGYPEGIRADRFEEWTRTVEREWGGAVGVELWAPSEAGNQEFEHWWARLLRQGTSPSGAIDLLSLYLEIDVRSVLGTIGAPTLVLHRTGDRMVPLRQGRYLAERIPDARMVELERRRPPRVRRRQRRPAGRGRGVPASAAARPATSTGCSRRCSSPTSSARPKPPPGSATVAGASCSRTTTRPCGVRSPFTGAAR